MEAGKKFGRLKYIKDTPWNDQTCVDAICQCDCGTTITVTYRDLMHGKIDNCGCVKKEQDKKREKIKARIEHGPWRAMIYLDGTYSVNRSVCKDMSITVHPPWRKSLPQFIKDVGSRPSVKHSLRRFPDINGNFIPGNVKWMTLNEYRKALYAITYPKVKGQPCE